MRVILQCEHVREEDLVQFLSPNLVCLHIKGDDCTRWFFEQIKVSQGGLELVNTDYN